MRGSILYGGNRKFSGFVGFHIVFPRPSGNKWVEDRVKGLRNVEDKLLGIGAF